MSDVMTKEQFEFLKERLAFAHKDMSNEASDYRAITDKPIFYVQEQKEIHGVIEEYHGNVKTYYLYHDKVFDSMDDLQEYCDTHCDEPLDHDDIEYGYSIMTWVDVCAHLTREAAQSYIDQNKHNLKTPRIYVKSMNRCYEMIGLVEAIINGNIVYKEGV